VLSPSPLNGERAGVRGENVSTGPIRLPRNQLETRNSKLETLNQLTGWWNSVATGDFDGDGRQDIVAGNWGRNTKYQNYRSEPLRLFYGEWKGNGSMEPIEACYDPGIKKVVPWCSFAVAKSLPWVP